MATIVARPRKGGKISYMAKLILTKGGKVIYRETKTFDRRAAAVAWFYKRKAEVEQPGGIARAKRATPTLADAIDKYVRDSLKKIGKTKAQVLEAIKRHPIASRRCEDIASADIVSFAKDLSDGRQPQTVGNYISHLASVFAIAKPAWGMPLDKDAMADAQTVCRRLGIISKSRHRDRRPTLDEIDRVMLQLSKRAPQSIPMPRIVAFAIFSTRRQEEITRLLWEDFDEANSRIKVRDMKNPGQKIGNDVWCDLPAEAIAIIKTTPRADARIFPYAADTISASFTRACKMVDVTDLHFHDLRHDGISRLFEIGSTIPKAAMVSGHKSWQSLQRYTHIRQSGDKYAGWLWLTVLTIGLSSSRRALQPA